MQEMCPRRHPQKCVHQHEKCHQKPETIEITEILPIDLYLNAKNDHQMLNWSENIEI